MQIYSYWCGDFFIRHMLISALKREKWKFKTPSGSQRLKLGKYRKKAIENLNRGSVKVSEIEQFPSSVEMDLFAERQNEILAIEIKTRLFARIGKSDNEFLHSTMHFSTPFDGLIALEKLRRQKSYDLQQDEINTISEFYRYQLALNRLNDREKGEFHSYHQMKISDFLGVENEGFSIKTAVVVPFYCRKQERVHIAKSQKKINSLLSYQHLKTFPFSIWVIQPISKMINKNDLPPKVRLNFFDGLGENPSKPPQIKPSDITYAYNLTKNRRKYRGCKKCVYKKHIPKDLR